MTSSAKNVIKRLKGETGKSRIGLYINGDLYKKAKKLCEQEGVVISRVIEEYLKEFIGESPGAVETKVLSSVPNEIVEALHNVDWNNQNAKDAFNIFAQGFIKKEKPSKKNTG